MDTVAQRAVPRTRTIGGETSWRHPAWRSHDHGAPVARAHCRSNGDGAHRRVVGGPRTDAVSPRADSTPPSATRRGRFTSQSGRHHDRAARRCRAEGPARRALGEGRFREPPRAGRSAGRARCGRGGSSRPRANGWRIATRAERLLRQAASVIEAPRRRPPSRMCTRVPARPWPRARRSSTWWASRHGVGARAGLRWRGEGHRTRTPPPKVQPPSASRLMPPASPRSQSRHRRQPMPPPPELIGTTRSRIRIVGLQARRKGVAVRLARRESETGLVVPKAALLHDAVTAARGYTSS